MRLLWQSPDRYVAWWWALLAAAGITNIIAWCALYSAHGTRAANEIGAAEAMFLLCAAYVFGCAYRSFLPRADVQRFCLFDTWLSSIAVGRSVATVAEVSFAAQWALMLDLLADLTGAPGVSAVAIVIVPLIVTAQLCSWYGVLTTNFLANAIENSIWAMAFALVAFALFQLAPAFTGLMHVAIIAGIAGVGAYLAFLVLIDIPMYLSRSRAEPRQQFLSLRAGFWDASTRRIVTHDFAHWRQEIPWMSLYFTAAVWASLLLCFSYSVRDQLPHYRLESVGATSLKTAVDLAPVPRGDQGNVRTP